MPGALREETAQLLGDYVQHRLGGAALPPPSRTAETLRRVADELESRERLFFRNACSAAALPEPGEAAALLGRVATQMEAEGGLNWGRVVALVVFAGNLAAALAERGAPDHSGALVEALAAYLAEERRDWLEAHGGWVSASPAPPRPSLACPPPSSTSAALPSGGSSSKPPAPPPLLALLACSPTSRLLF
ncbi:putative Bcl-2 related anti-apoptotic protein [Naja naja]|nr:putative Bcl-2 related anti-apoptotic protein [Naja naja]